MGFFLVSFFGVLFLWVFWLLSFCWFFYFFIFSKAGGRVEWKNMKEAKVFHMAEQIFLPEDLRNNVMILTWQAELDQ